METGNVKTLTNWLNESEELINSRGEKPELPITCIPTLNRKIWGLHKQKMTVIAARTSQGKSVAALNFALDLAMQKKKVYFISLEMSVPQMVERMFCILKNIDNFDLLTGKIKKDDYIKRAWVDFKQMSPQIPLLMSDMIGRNWQEVDAVITALGTKPDAVFIDHLQEISAKGMNKKEAIEDYLNHMRELAIRNNFALIVCSQINRMGQADKDRRPQLHQIKDAGAVEEKADVVMLLHWEYHYKDDAERNRMELNVAKNRCGPTGNIVVKFVPEHYRLEEYGSISNNKRIDVGTRITGERCEEDNLYNANVQYAEQPSGDSQYNEDQEKINWEE